MSVATNFIGFCFVANLKALGAVIKSSFEMTLVSFFILLQKINFVRSFPHNYTRQQV